MAIMELIKKRSKSLLLINIVLLFLLVANSIWRDFNLQKLYPQDLRNRVIGARLIKEGKMPYFFKWKKGDSEKLIDVFEYKENYKINLLTSTPFFQRLFIPISNYDFIVIAKIWLLVSYACLLIIILLFLSLKQNFFLKIIGVNLIVLFTYTEAWILHNFLGQLYLFISTIFCVILFLLLSKRFKSFPLAGFFTVVLLLIRPNALVFLIPIFILPKTFAKYIISVAFFVCAYGSFVLINKYEHRLWQEYFTAMDENVQYFRGNPTSQMNEVLPAITFQEGYNFNEVNKLRAESNPNYLQLTECINFYDLYKIVLHKDASVLSANIIYLLIIVAILLIIFRRRKLLATNVLTLLGFCVLLYLITDFFMPSRRLQYYTVQYLLAIFIVLLQLKNYKNFYFAFLLFGIWLNISNTSLIPLRHTIGEFVILFVLLGISIKNTRQSFIQINPI